MSEKDEALRRHAKNKTSKIDEVKKITGLSTSQIKSLLDKDPTLFDLTQVNLNAPNRPTSLQDIKVDTKKMHEKIITSNLHGKAPTAWNPTRQKVTVSDLIKNEMDDPSHHLRKRMKFGGTIGAGLALTSNLFDDEKSTLLGTAWDTGVGFGIGTLAHYGIDKAMEHTSTGRKASNWLGEQIPELIDQKLVYNNDITKVTPRDVMDRNLRVTAKDVAKEQDQKLAKDTLNSFKENYGTSDLQKDKIFSNQTDIKEFDEDKIRTNARKATKAMKIGALVGAGLIAVGTVADVSQRLHRSSSTERMVNEQEKNLERKQISEEKMLKSLGSNYTDFGQLAFDLFSDRIGHHKMGNAKF